MQLIWKCTANLSPTWGAWLWLFPIGAGVPPHQCARSPNYPPAPFCATAASPVVTLGQTRSKGPACRRWLWNQFSSKRLFLPNFLAHYLPGRDATSSEHCVTASAEQQASRDCSSPWPPCVFAPMCTCNLLHLWGARAAGCSQSLQEDSGPVSGDSRAASLPSSSRQTEQMQSWQGTLPLTAWKSFSILDLSWKKPPSIAAAHEEGYRQYFLPPNNVQAHWQQRQTRAQLAP